MRKINKLLLFVLFVFPAILMACDVEEVLLAGFVGRYKGVIDGTRQEKGALAEDVITAYFAKKGFIPCDVKINGNNGVDHFFVAEADGEKIYVVNESKYKGSGGSPAFGRYKLSDGTKCYQQSWHWIADRMKRFAEGPRRDDDRSSCSVSRGFAAITGGEKHLCTSCSTDVKKVLRNLRAKVVRTATVMDEYGNIRLFAVMDRKEDSRLHNKVLKSLGVKAIIAECPKSEGHYKRSRL